MKLVYIFTILGLSLAEAYQQAKIEILPLNLFQAATTYIPPSQRQRDWQTHQPIKAPIPWVPQVQNDYYGDSNSAPQQTSTTTTPVPVIKNEFYMGNNGDYKYEYQIADGTSVGEQGYFTDPNQNEESIVKKGWYSFLGADGITYTVTYWADHTGYHAFGSHLPAGASGYVDNPSQQGSSQQPPYPSIPTNPTYNPPQQSYNPPQQSYNPPQQSYNPPQQSYNPPQQTYNPPQQTYNPPQESYNPPQQSYNPPQQTYTPPQQTYIPPQESYSPPQQSYNPSQQSYNPPQESYNPPQESYNPPQESYTPPQESYNPPQQSYNQPQQQNYYLKYNV